MSEIFCDLNAIPAEKRARHELLWKALEKARLRIDELADGYTLQLEGSAETLVNLAEWMSLERLCCPFFIFTVRVHQHEVSVSLTGQEGVKALLASEFQIPTT